MTQKTLFQVRNIAKGIERKAVKNYMDEPKHDKANRIAAEVILADVERWGPGLEKWARLCLGRIGR